MTGVTTLCIARERSDWHPTGSSTYEQAPTFLLTCITPELKGSLLSPKLHQCFSVFHKVKIKNTLKPAKWPRRKKKEYICKWIKYLLGQAQLVGASIEDHIHKFSLAAGNRYIFSGEGIKKSSVFFFSVLNVMPGEVRARCWTCLTIARSGRMHGVTSQNLVSE